MTERSHAVRGAAPEAQPAAIRQGQGGPPRVPTPAERRAVFRDSVAAAKPNHTGLPGRLKAGVEALSGFSLSDVRVHYNSARPAQLQAHAFAQGSDIHVAPGQERHLPHETWHVVQQKQGRVKATRQLKGIGLNDDPGLEREADQMAARALSVSPGPVRPEAEPRPISAAAPAQRRVGYEFETNVAVTDPRALLPQKKPFYGAGEWHVEPDAGYIEFVTAPLSKKEEVAAVLKEVVAWGQQLLAVPIVAPAKSASSSKDVKEPVSQQPVEPLPDKQTVRKTLEKLEFTGEEADELLNRFGLRIVWDIVAKDPPPKSMIQSLAKVLFEMETERSKPSQSSASEEEEEISKHNSYRELDRMKVPDRWIRKGLIAPGAETGMTASPQATIGTALHRIGALMKAIPTTRIKAGLPKGSTTLTARVPEHGQMLAEASARAAEMVKSLRGKDGTDQEWAELEGLLALMVSYILMGQRATKKFKYSKDIAPLMSRVNFLAMYQALAEAPRKLFTPELVAKTAGVSADTRVFGKFGFGDAGKGQAVAGPTVAGWVESILKKTDVMSVIGKTEVVDPARMGAPSMGAEAALDTVGTEVPKGLAPLELRRIGGSVPLIHWPSLAMEIFDFSAHFDDRDAKLPRKDDSSDKKDKNLK